MLPKLDNVQDREPERPTGTSAPELTPEQFAERRASVDRLLADMAAENERRRDWHKQPVPGWREGRIAWRNVVTGEETVLRFKAKRSGR
jgi:hypothetical protein